LDLVEDPLSPGCGCGQPENSEADEPWLTPEHEGVSISNGDVYIAIVTELSDAPSRCSLVGSVSNPVLLVVRYSYRSGEDENEQGGTPALVGREPVRTKESMATTIFACAADDLGSHDE
jgi:hypothetical protein